MWESFLIDDWHQIVRAVVSAALLYAFVILSVRVSGKRSTSQMNNFDWVVTVAIGSLMASGILLKDVSLLESMIAIATLLGLQFLLTWAMLRWQPLEDLVRADPRLLFHEGEFLWEAMRRERVCKQEVLSAIRANGMRDLDEVQCVILETNASLSVLPRPEGDGGRRALQDVHGINIES